MADESLYKVSKFFMVPAGLWKKPISKNFLIQKVYSTYSVAMQIHYILYNVSMIVRMIQLLKEYQISQLYRDISLMILIFEINLKVMIYLKNRVPQMFFTVIEREGEILGSDNAAARDIYLDQVRFYKMATFCQYTSTGLAIALYAALSLYRKLVRGMSPDENFMYQLWFPFDKKKHDTFVTFYNLFMAGFGFCFNCGVQTPLQTLMVFSTSQLRILQDKITRYFDVSRTGNVTDMKELIREHQFLIEFITKLNAAIKYIILFEFALESINGAGALLQVLMVNNALEFSFALMYVILLLVNLIVLGWSSNEILTQSANVANAVYNCNWMDQDETVKRLLLLMMMRAQKPLSIDIGPFRPMDTQAAFLTIKGSYTYAQVVRHTTS